MLTLVLAVLSISAAIGMRLALPLLVISLFYSQEFWTDVPILRHLEPRVILAISISWSLLELFISKKLLGQRVLQVIQLVFSPMLGAIIAIAFAHIAQVDFTPFWLIGLVGGIFALVLTIVQIGWFFRLRGLPIWVVLMQDILGILLVLLAFASPREGGLIALLLLWLAIRSSTAWRNWYLASQKTSS
ncbi:MAG TPA: DUF4126 domain-containing protein [Xenococcaceae cyanobacterium]|jgi:hypothetical protein